ncbi:hypothetical protein SAMN05216204_1472 [Massilia yuzhufengensis]|uniref:Uncharacterized protein n=1 Tax=Massilia yuzhufengensis TaxID=1164594 RepID=A0A1I1WFD2_9BURK|nr:hypothetical protein SAMN05216204_1472 [Massilia yuzhufengensis]
MLVWSWIRVIGMTYYFRGHKNFDRVIRVEVDGKNTYFVLSVLWNFDNALFPRAEQFSIFNPSDIDLHTSMPRSLDRNTTYESTSSSIWENAMPIRTINRKFGYSHFFVIQS